MYLDEKSRTERKKQLGARIRSLPPVVHHLPTSTKSSTNDYLQLPPERERARQRQQTLNTILEGNNESRHHKNRRLSDMVSQLAISPHIQSKSAFSERHSL